DRALALAYDDSRAALGRVFGDLPSAAFVERGGGEMEVPLRDLLGTDRLIARAGTTLAVDGTVLAGVIVVDEHALTGEAEPAERRPGDRVFAGTTVLAGDARIAVGATGDETLIARIGALLNQTADFRTSSQLFCERVVDASVAPAFGLWVLTTAALGPISGLAAITCAPAYQMRYTGPLAINNYLHRAAHGAILVKDGRALERTMDVDVVVFDKTGTLTDTRLRVVAVHTLGPEAAERILRLAAAAESRQPHPIADAITDASSKAGIADAEPTHVESVVGLGVRAVVDGRQVTVGSRRFLLDQGCLPGPAAGEDFGATARGNTPVFVAFDGAPVGVIELAARLRPEARQVVADLEALGLEVMVLSGDNQRTTAALAERLGVGTFAAEVLPHQKAEFVERLQAEGRKVCFVGDGINDAIALKVAHVSISLRGATTAALDTAHVILNEPDLRHVPRYLELARSFNRTMRRNLVVSIAPAAVNLVGIYALGTGVLTAAMCSWTGLALGAANSELSPRLDGSAEAHVAPLAVEEGAAPALGGLSPQPG
ncbi:MAG: heavy metal translocating P-type ATPase, partial [Myxococcales bacterium]|nr:heavy metal translocating P-type ATPase [Myxococcales bacterium]